MWLSFQNGPDSPTVICCLVGGKSCCAGLMLSGSEAMGRGYKVREGGQFSGEESCWMSVRRFRVNQECLLEPSSFIAVSHHRTQDLFIASRRLSQQFLSFIRFS